MIHKLILDQLNEIKDLPNIDPETLTLNIPKRSEKINMEMEDIFELAHTYIIKLEKYIIEPPSTFNLHDNWNKGIKPKDTIMKVTVVNDIGKMIKINGSGYNQITGEENSNKWEGWVPKKSVKIIQEM